MDSDTQDTKDGRVLSAPGSREPSPAVSAVPASIPRAIAFATAAHEGQLYGGLPYVKAHVAKVAEIARQYARIPEQEVAAWLHDVIEDTPVSRHDIQSEFGHEVACLVWACTGVGQNRKERNLSIYQKLREHPRAVLVKVADRIANVEASAPHSGHRAMYRKEAEAFRAVVERWADPAMLKRLDAAYASGMQLREDGLPAEAEGLQPDPKGDAQPQSRDSTNG